MATLGNRSIVKLASIGYVAIALSLTAGGQANAHPGDEFVEDYDSGYHRCVEESNTPDAYYSPRLKAQLRLQKLAVPGSVFWGGRLVYVAPDSPLRRLKLDSGDVITHLDGNPIYRNRYWIPIAGGRGYWAIPQCERHYGITEVRHYHSGELTAHTGNVRLGPSISPNIVLASGDIPPP